MREGGLWEEREKPWGGGREALRREGGLGEDGGRKALGRRKKALGRREDVLGRKDGALRMEGSLGRRERDSREEGGLGRRAAAPPYLTPSSAS